MKLLFSFVCLPVLWAIPVANVPVLEETNELIQFAPNIPLVTVLENGMQVVTKEVPDFPVVSVQVWHRVGSRDEDPGANGVSHLLEHLLFKGTKERPVQFMRLFHVLGADANAYTDYDTTVYHEITERDKLYHLLALEADRLQGAVIDEDQVTSEKDVVISELVVHEGNEVYVLHRATMNETFGYGKGYGLPIGGRLSDVQSLAVDQVRQHYNRHYGPANATLVIVGDFNTTQALAWVRELFSPPAHLNMLQLQRLVFFYLISTGLIFVIDPFFGYYLDQYLRVLWQQIFETDGSSPSVRSYSDSSFHRNVFNASTTSAHITYHIEDHAASHANQILRDVIDDPQIAQLLTPANGLITSDNNSPSADAKTPDPRDLGVDLQLPPDFKKALQKHVLTHSLRVMEQQTRLHLAKEARAEKAAEQAVGSLLQTEEEVNFVLSRSEPLVMAGNGDGVLVEVLFPMPNLTSVSIFPPMMDVLDYALVGGSMGLFNRWLRGYNISTSGTSSVLASHTAAGWYGLIVKVETQADAIAAVDAIGDFVGHLRKSSIAQTDVDRARMNVLVAFLDRQSSDVEEMASSVGYDFVMTNDVLYPHRYFQTVNGINREHLRYCINTLFVEGSATVSMRVSAIANLTFVANNNNLTETEGDSVTRHKRANTLDSISVSRAVSFNHKKCLHCDPDDPFATTPFTTDPELSLSLQVLPDEISTGRRVLGGRDLTLVQVNVGDMQESSVPTGFQSPVETITNLPPLPSIINHVEVKVDGGRLLTLSNGLEVMLFPKDGVPLVDVQARVVVGSNNDPIGKAGLASMTAHMLAQGSMNYSVVDITYNLEMDGSSLDIFPGRETSVLTGQSLSVNLKRLLLIIRECLMFPRLDASRVDLLRMALTAKVDADKDSAEVRALDLLRRAIYPTGHPMRSVSSSASLSSISVDDVNNFYRKYYGPKSTRIVVSGAFDVDVVETLLRDLFGTWNSNATAASLDVIPVMALNGSQQIYSIDAEAHAITLMGKIGVTRCSAQYWIAMVASQILGGDTISSRLGNYVRDNMGLTYGVFSYHEARYSSGMLLIRMQTAPDKTKEGISAVQSVLSDFWELGVSNLEVEIAKRHFLSQHTLSLSRRSSVGTFAINERLCGSKLSVEDQVADVYQKILSVSVDDVNEYIKVHMNPLAFHTVTAGSVEPQ